jgi:dTDP-glucose 4,6-dehydratase
MIFVKTNVLGTEVLLESARKFKISRFHHISTDEVYGSLELGSDEKFNENSNYHPNSPYSASKAAADHLVRAYYQTFGLSVTITNCSNNFGPYQFPEKLIPLAITNILEDKKVPVYGRGDQVRDWLYVTDHCLAIEAVIEKGKIGETYCIGGLGKELTNLELVRKIIHLLGKDNSWIEYVKDRPGHDVRYAMDWKKINHDLGWKPKYTLADALQMTVDWYKNNTKWWQRVKTGEYQSYYKKLYENK